MRQLLLCISLTITLTSGVCQSFKTIVKKPTVHAVIVSNTLDKKIGKSCLLDYYNFSNQVRVIGNAIGFNIREYPLIGANFSKLSLETILSKKLITTNDIVILYFSSHGFSNYSDSSLFPNLVTNNKQEFINPESIHKKIKKLYNPTLLITIIDACNSYAPIPNSQIIYFKQKYEHEFPKVLTSSQLIFYSHLFKYSKGDIIITSSQVGATSLATSSGSVFTNSFINKLEQLSNTNYMYGISWNDFLNQLKDAVKAEAFRISYLTQKDTTYRFPIWKKTIKSTQYPHYDDGIPEIRIYLKKNNEFHYDSIGNTYLKLQIGLIQRGLIREMLSNKIESVVYYILDSQHNKEIKIIAQKENYFYETAYVPNEEFIIYATVKFKNGHTLDVTTLQK